MLYSQIDQNKYNAIKVFSSRLLRRPIGQWEVAPT